MSELQVELSPGFAKADASNLPTISGATVLGFITKLHKDKTYAAALDSSGSDLDLNVDFVQVKQQDNECCAKCIVLPRNNDLSKYAAVSVIVDLKTNELTAATCGQCDIGYCSHVVAFVFWLHRKSSESGAPSFGTFWGSEAASQLPINQNQSLHVRDLFVSDEVRSRSDVMMSSVNEQQGKAFIDSIMDEMANMNLKTTAFYQHFRPLKSEFESVLIHHTMLRTKGKAKDVHSFLKKLEEGSKPAVYARLAEATRSSYKALLWLETQYMRIRCSMFHRIATRKDDTDVEAILDSMFSRGREYSFEEQQRLKIHKHFILRQTEKLENKTYKDCGILVNKSFPYICAMPDGLAEDHIVEIKVPTNDTEFDQYLEGQENIAPKYMAQLQIQMFVANVPKALYCVLSPSFDTSGALHYVWVQADVEFVANLLAAAEEFWRDIVFPRLYQSYFQTSLS